MTDIRFWLVSAMFLAMIGIVIWTSATGDKLHNAHQEFFDHCHDEWAKNNERVQKFITEGNTDSARYYLTKCKTLAEVNEWVYDKMYKK